VCLAMYMLVFIPTTDFKMRLHYFASCTISTCKKKTYVLFHDPKQLCVFVQLA
jgi:hypothetical protein